jgi:hypothetical protein
MWLTKENAQWVGLGFVFSAFLIGLKEPEYLYELAWILGYGALGTGLIIVGSQKSA